MGKNEKRVLVVDDDDAIRTLLFTVLRRRGFRVDTARNGEDALSLNTRCRYALILLDLMMPRMSGYEVLDRLAKMPTNTRPLVIVLTAGTSSVELDADCVTGMVRKPFDLELLLDAITACLSTCEELPQFESCPAPESEAFESPNLTRPAN